MKKRSRRVRGIFRWLFAALICMAMAAPLRLGNAYLRSGDFDIVRVKRHECVWEIASRYTTNMRDARALVEAIIEVNGLTSDGVLRAGQNLRVPVLHKALPPQMAER